MNHIEANDFPMMDAKRARIDAKIIIKDLDTTKISKTDLEERFRKHGKIVDITMGRGYASVCYENENSAYDAIRYEHRSLMKDSRIDVSMTNKTIHSPLNRAERGGNRNLSLMRGDVGDGRNEMMMRGDRSGDRDGSMSRGGRGGDRDGSMMRGIMGDDRDGSMIRSDRNGLMPRGDSRVGDRDGPVPRGDRGGDREGLVPRGDRGGDRDGPVPRGDRGGDRDGPVPRGDRGGDRDGPVPRGDRGGDRDGPVPRGDRGGDRDGSVPRGDRGGDRDGPLPRGDRGGDRDGPLFRGGRGGDRDGPMMRGDRGGNRDGLHGHADKGSPSRKERNFRDKPRDIHRFGRGNFPRDASPARGIHNFRLADRHNAPHHPVQTQYSDYFDSQFPYKPNDCEIVVVSKQQREYAESIEVRLKNIGFRVDVLFLKDENVVVNTVDDVSRRGCLYAMVVAPINEAKKSVTLDVLHGMPQEHRNMPLDDALKFIARDFHEYLQRQREKADLNHMCYDSNGTFSGSDPEVRVLLKMLSDGQFLTLLELERLINSLEKQKELLLAVCSKRNSLDSPGLQKERMPSMHHVELQSNAFPSNQAQFNPAALLGNTNESSSIHAQEDNMMSSSYINFNNPSVKQALDNLIQSGPGLLKNLVGAPEESGEESQNTRLSDMDLGINLEMTQNFSAVGNFVAAGLGHNTKLGNDQPFLSGGPMTNNLFGILPQKF